MDVYILKSAEKFDQIEFPKPQMATIKQEIPPYNGFGSVEDSLASCLNLIPKAPRRYIYIYMYTILQLNCIVFNVYSVPEKNKFCYYTPLHIILVY